MFALIDEYRKELLQITTSAKDTGENYVSCLVWFNMACFVALEQMQLIERLQLNHRFNGIQYAIDGQ